MRHHHTPSQRLVARPDRPRQEESLPFPNVEAGESTTIAGRFQKFHAAHPEVYTEIVRMARQAKDRQRRIGMKAIFEVIRWNREVVRGEDTFKLNNIYSSRYARLVEEREPDLAGFFTTRELKSA